MVEHRKETGKQASTAYPDRGVCRGWSQSKVTCVDFVPWIVICYYVLDEQRLFYVLLLRDYFTRLFSTTGFVLGFRQLSSIGMIVPEFFGRVVVTTQYLGQLEQSSMPAMAFCRALS